MISGKILSRDSKNLFPGKKDKFTRQGCKKWKKVFYKALWGSGQYSKGTAGGERGARATVEEEKGGENWGKWGGGTLRVALN